MTVNVYSDGSTSISSASNSNKDIKPVSLLVKSLAVTEGIKVDWATVTSTSVVYVAVSSEVIVKSFEMSNPLP